ncbi:ferritin-like domain-containing protein [soil metagenome]
MLDAIENASTRRGFVTTAAVAAAAVMLAKPARVFAVSPAFTFSNIPGSGDVQVLNYALALEDLEADLYAQAVARLTSGNASRGIKGLKISKYAPDVRTVAEFGKVEIEHRDFLRSALTSVGGPVISPFKYDFNINSLNRKDVLNLIYTAEKTGVAAYLGAIPLLSINSPYLQIAGAIQGTEARHTAYVAETINFMFHTAIPVAPLAGGGTTALSKAGIDEPLTPDAVLAAVSPFIVA